MAEIKTPASSILRFLNTHKKTPKIAKRYTLNIIYSHKVGRIYDPNIAEAIDILEAPLRKNTHEIA